MLLGYNTNGLSFHRLEDAVALVAQAGYRSLALTLDHHHLDPSDREEAVASARRLQPLIEQHRLRVTIETGARFILDPLRKHQPTLTSARGEDRARRIGFLATSVDVATALEADSVSLWSGAPDDDADEATLAARLREGLGEVLDHAQRAGVRLAFEPEPGMFIDTMTRFAELHDAVNHPLFGLTLDVSHVHCLGDGDVGEHIRRWRYRLWNVHIADARRGVHEHLMFGDGEMEFEPMFKALSEIDYAGPIHVELSRHSHVAVDALREAHTFLARFVP